MNYPIEPQIPLLEKELSKCLTQDAADMLYQNNHTKSLNDKSRCSLKFPDLDAAATLYENNYTKSLNHKSRCSINSC